MTQRVVLILALLAPAFAGGAAPPPTTPAQTSRPATATSRPAPKPTPKPVVAPVLEGTVKGPDAKPIEGALVSASPVVGRWDEPARTCRTDATGHFKLDLASTDPHDVRVEARGLAAVRLDKVRPGQSLLVALGRGRAIDGTVRDEGGQPIVGARVTARSDRDFPPLAWEQGPGRLEGTTDGRGRFRLEGVAPGLHTVKATARGYAEVTKQQVRPGTTVGFALPSGGWISGRVLDPNGVAVKGALVRAEQEPRFFATSQTEATDTEGRFELTGLSAGRYTVVANDRSFAPGIESGVNVSSDGSTDVTITLAIGGSVRGRLIDGQQHPVQGLARIQELTRQELPPSVGALLMSEAKGDGRFAIERVPAGTFTVGVTAPGYAGQRVEAEVGLRQAVIDLGDIPLERGLTIQGRVRTASGTPVAAAAINAYDQDGQETFARSGDDGSFLLAGLQPHTYDIDVRAAGFASLQKQAAPSPEDLDLVVSPGGAISGLVVEDGDRPLDSYRVVANADRADHRTSSDAQRTVGSPDGRFLLEDVAEGTYVIQVLAPERAPGSASGIKVVAGRTTDAGTIRLGRGGIVRGTVLDLGGNAVSGATVKAVGPTEGRQRWMDLSTALTDSAGSFEIQGVAPGNATVGATHPQYAPTETAVVVDPVKGPAEVRLTLQQGGRIDGSARRREGTPLAGLSVSAWSLRNRSVVAPGIRGVTTGNDGSFTLEHVAPGTVEVSLMADAGPNHMVGILGKAVEVREGETTVVEFVQREILVTGHTTRSGAPLPGLRLELWGEHSSFSSFGDSSRNVPAPPAGPQHMRATSGDDGSFAMIVDEPDRFSLSATSLDGKTQYPSREVDIPDVDNHSLELDFPGALVNGLVVDKETEQPLQAAQVWARAKSPRADSGAGGETGADGRFVLSLEAGDYVLTTRAERHAEARTEFTVGADGATELRVALEKGLEIAGRIVDVAGRGVSEVFVAAMSEDDRFGGVQRTLADGSFRFGTLADAVYTLCGGNERVGFGLRSGLKPGAKDVTLTLRPAGHVKLLVRGPDGVPLVKAYPRVVRVGGARARVPPGGVGVPPPSGGAVVMAVPAGNLEIEVRSDKYKGSLPITVAEGATVPAEITLTEPIGGAK